MKRNLDKLKQRREKSHARLQGDTLCQVFAEERKPGPPKGHEGWGGRPRGVEMPCGWGCGAKLTAREMREHFTTCKRRPPAAIGKETQGA